MNNKPFYLLMIAAASAFLLGSCREDNQAGSASIELSIKEKTVDAASGSFTVDVNSSQAYSVNTPSWISIDPQQDTYESGTLTFNYTENTATSERRANVIFRCADIKDTLVVIQSASEKEDLYRPVFLEETEPGLYGEKIEESYIYQDYISQYSIRTAVGGQTFDYKLMSLNPPKYIFVKSIPTSMEVGDKQYLGLQQNITDVITTNSSPNTTVEKIEGNKVWLYDTNNKIRIILTTE